MRKSCLNTVFELAKKNKKVIFVGSDLGPGVLDAFKQKYPNRFLMEGVTEQSIIGLAAGLAFENFRPYVNTIATFITRRCFEQVIVDLCLHNLPVTLIGRSFPICILTFLNSNDSLLMIFIYLIGYSWSRLPLVLKNIILSDLFTSMAISVVSFLPPIVNVLLSLLTKPIF